MQLLNYGREFAHDCCFHEFHAQGKVVIINNRILRMEEPGPYLKNLSQECNLLNCIQFIIPNHKIWLVR